VRIVIAGGGTAGHVVPALAIARTLVDEHGASVHFIGTPDGLESRLVPSAGFPFTSVDAVPLRRELSTRALLAPIAAVRSIGDCAPVVAGADVVIGVGGYASVPAVLASWWARRPVVLHEQNAVPGLANRLLARRSAVVCASFAESIPLLPRTRTVVTGNPVREAVLDVPRRRAELRGEAHSTLGLAEERRTVLVFGGSQGALSIDRAVAGAARILRARSDLQLLVLTGRSHLREVSEPSPGDGALRVIAVPFLDRMELAYAAADLVVARAGATTIAEVAVCGLAAILVPYPYATGNHQEANARALERAGAATIVPDRALSAELLARRVTTLVEDDVALERMRANAARWARPDAARAVAREVVAARREIVR
jgi:UDP-N-acetylglucosamine--N-acetylmuramyl-(pentapeptide) pyrophosphoryl-undecaprenol N-acetylglucosamine transferase